VRFYSFSYCPAYQLRHLVLFSQWVGRCQHTQRRSFAAAREALVASLRCWHALNKGVRRIQNALARTVAFRKRNHFRARKVFRKGLEMRAVGALEAEIACFSSPTTKMFGCS